MKSHNEKLKPLNLKDNNFSILWQPIGKPKQEPSKQSIAPQKR